MKILYCVIAIVLAVVLFSVFKPVAIKGVAMEPNYPDGSYYFQSAIAYIFTAPNRGDAIVFRFTHNPIYKGVFRIVGLPGEKLTIKDGKVYINGENLLETYLSVQDKTFTLDALEIQKVDETKGAQVKTGKTKVIEEGLEIQIPENSYFLLGDNREHSADSRAYGFVNKKDILGKLVFRYK